MTANRTADRMPELVSILVILLASTVLVLAARHVRFSRVPVAEPQKTPFLGGGSPKSHAWQRYHVRYYPMTLVFVAFEMEMMFMYPWAVVFAEVGLKAMVEMGMFLAILSLGIFYGWREGAFRWQ